MLAPQTGYLKFGACTEARPRECSWSPSTIVVDSEMGRRQERVITPRRKIIKERQATMREKTQGFRRAFPQRPCGSCGDGRHGSRCYHGRQARHFSSRMRLKQHRCSTKNWSLACLRLDLVGRHDVLDYLLNTRNYWFRFFA
jgi:hypothetical protein